MNPETPPPPSLSVALICFSHAWGGLEIMVTKIAAALSTRGHRVFLISPSGSPIEAEAVRQGLTHISMTPRMKYLDPKIIGELGRLFRRHQIGIALATLSRDISTVVLAGRFSPGTKLVYFQQMQFGHSKRDLFHRWTYSALDSWITLTRAMKNSVVQNTIVKERILDVIPFGTDRTVFDPRRSSRKHGRSVFQLPNNSLLVGFIGRLDKQKGCEEFIRAAAIVRKSAPKSLFILAGEETHGEPGYADSLRSLSDSLGLKQHIRFLPFTREVPLFLASLDVLAVPSYSETFGYVAIEGMAMGLPVVGTNAGGLPEIIVDGETGFLVPPRNPEELARPIISLLKKPALRKAMGTKGQKRVKERFDFRKNIKMLEALFQRLSSTGFPSATSELSVGA
ncbi:MAG: glycosyltransferase family 4 protein [Bacteroidota bacterium]